jgi:hypothetical protein
VKYVRLFIYHVVTPIVGVVMWCLVAIPCLLFVLWCMAHLS